MNNSQLNIYNKPIESYGVSWYGRVGFLKWN